MGITAAIAYYHTGYSHSHSNYDPTTPIKPLLRHSLLDSNNNNQENSISSSILRSWHPHLGGRTPRSTATRRSSLDMMIAHYTPTVFPMTPQLIPSYLQNCRISWNQIVSQRYQEDLHSPEIHGITLFYNDFYSRLSKIDPNNIYEHILLQHGRGANKIATKGAILIRIVDFILRLDGDSSESKRRLHHLGILHRLYGVKGWQYAGFLETFLHTLSARLEENATIEVMESWVNVLGYVLQHMLRASIVDEEEEEEEEIAGMIASYVKTKEEDDKLHGSSGGGGGGGCPFSGSGNNNNASAKRHLLGMIGSAPSTVHEVRNEDEEEEEEEEEDGEEVRTQVDGMDGRGLQGGGSGVDTTSPSPVSPDDQVKTTTTTTTSPPPPREVGEGGSVVVVENRSHQENEIIDEQERMIQSTAQAIAQEMKNLIAQDGNNEEEEEEEEEEEGVVVEGHGQSHNESSDERLLRQLDGHHGLAHSLSLLHPPALSYVGGGGGGSRHGSVGGQCPRHSL